MRDVVGETREGGGRSRSSWCTTWTLSLALGHRRRGRCHDPPQWIPTTLLHTHISLLSIRNDQVSSERREERVNELADVRRTFDVWLLTLSAIPVLRPPFSLSHSPKQLLLGIDKRDATQATMFTGLVEVSLSCTWPAPDPMLIHTQRMTDHRPSHRHPTHHRVRRLQLHHLIRRSYPRRLCHWRLDRRQWVLSYRHRV
jgi:hypothetical protein